MHTGKLALQPNENTSANDDARNFPRGISRPWTESDH